jgi:hypothetical protein
MAEHLPALRPLQDSLTGESQRCIGNGTKCHASLCQARYKPSQLNLAPPNAKALKQYFHAPGPALALCLFKRHSAPLAASPEQT